VTSLPPVRVFVALELPEVIKKAIRSEQETLMAELPQARWTRPEGQHLTLKFFGEIPAALVDELRERIAGRVAGLPAVVVALGGSGFFPNQRRPRVAWLAGAAEGGREVARAVEDAAIGCGFAAERRPWSLHLTQARLHRPWPRPAVERFLAWGRALDLASFTCPEIVLFASDLRPGGAVYTALERIPLR
jgi:2'-5' RNA ligase